MPQKNVTLYITYTYAIALTQHIVVSIPHIIIAFSLSPFAPHIKRNRAREARVMPQPAPALKIIFIVTQMLQSFPLHICYINPATMAQLLHRAAIIVPRFRRLSHCYIHRKYRATLPLCCGSLRYCYIQVRGGGKTACHEISIVHPKISALFFKRPQKFLSDL